METKLSILSFSFLTLLLIFTAPVEGSMTQIDPPNGLHAPMSESVDGGGSVVPGSGEDPVVEYIWVLPDDDSIIQGTQVEIVPAGQDDETYACLVVSDTDSRDSIADVFVDVYHPDESFKYQIHGERLDIVDNAAEIEQCKSDALAAGLISSQDWEDINYNIFGQQNWYMYKVWLPMFYHQPAGEYEVRGYAVDTSSRLSAPLSTFFTWVPGTFLALDFVDVNFGNILPGNWKILNGDLIMGTPGAPTLKNNGNTEVLVGVEFSEFVGTDGNPNKKIIDFDAQLRNLGTNNHDQIPGEHLEFQAEQQVWFTYPIELCRQEKIDFSIHAPIGTVPDNYEGTVTIYADPVLVNSPEPDDEPFPRCGPHMNPDATCPIIT